LPPHAENAKSKLIADAPIARATIGLLFTRPRTAEQLRAAHGEAGARAPASH
jgi:hypothetical protein